MDVPFDLTALVGAPPGHNGPCVGLVDERALRGSTCGPLRTILEEMGRLSAKAQGLRSPVTFGNAESLGNHRVYLLVDGCTVMGLLKVGRKRLFVAPPVTPAFMDVKEAFREVEPLCALDFYVHEKCQRTGYGRLLFDAMLEREGAAPEQMAFDRPSNKLVAFLRRHYSLATPKLQSNKFVIYDGFFGAEGRERQAAHEQGPARCSRRGPVRDLFTPSSMASAIC